MNTTIGNGCSNGTNGTSANGTIGTSVNGTNGTNTATYNNDHKGREHDGGFGEMCVYGDNLALGYVKVGDGDRFIRVRLTGGQGEIRHRHSD